MGESSECKRESMTRNLRKYDAMPFFAIASVMNMTEDEVKRVCQEGDREAPTCDICGGTESFGLRTFKDHQLKDHQLCYPCHERAAAEGRHPFKFKEESTPGVAPDELADWEVDRLTEGVDDELDRARKIGPRATARALRARRRANFKRVSLSRPGEDELVRKATAVAEEKIRSDPCFPGATGALSEEILDIRDEILAELDKIDTTRQKARTAARSCAWTEAIRQLKFLRARASGLVKRVSDVLERHGEPER